MGGSNRLCCWCWWWCCWWRWWWLLQALLLEAFVMHGLKHPRIVSLVAVCTHAQPVMVCIEHMRNGDLKSFLRR